MKTSQAVQLSAGLLALSVLGLPGLRAQTIRLTKPIVTDGAFVTKRGASVQGELAGNLVALDESASIALEASAKVSGSLLVSADKTAMVLDLANGKAVKPSARTSIVNSGGATVLKGEVQAGSGFDLPRVLTPIAPAARSSVSLQAGVDLPTDYSKVGDLSLRRPKESVTLPAGNYGKIAVAQGTLVLGSAGSREPLRYELQSLEVQLGSSLTLLGPVVVTVADGLTIEGSAGNADSALWLDLRVAGGKVSVGRKGVLWGFVTAPKSLVSVAAGGRLVGGAASDELKLEAGASATVVAPDWTGKATEKTQPRFPHKALRLEANVPEFRANFRHSYSPGVVYIGDLPHLMLSEGNRPKDHPLLGYDTNRAFFEACCTLFHSTGFDRGVLTVVAYSEDPVKASGEVTNLVLLRSSYLAALTAVGGKTTEDDNIAVIARHPTRLEEFHRNIVTSANQSAAKN